MKYLKDKITKLTTKDNRVFLIRANADFENAIQNCRYIDVSGKFFGTRGNFYESKNHTYGFASLEEENWFSQCEIAKEFIEFEDIKQLNYEIY